MLPLIMIFAALVFTAVCYRELPIGRALHDMLIARPADWLMRTPPRRILIILVLLIGMALAWIELAPLLATLDYAPVLWFADMSLYLDVLLMAGVALAAVRVRSVSRFLVGRLRATQGVRIVRRRTRERASRPNRPRRSPPANDGDPGFAIPLAA